MSEDEQNEVVEHEHLLVLLCHATTAPVAMLAPQRSSDHAFHAEVGLVKLSQLQQFFYSRLLLAPAAGLWYVPGISHHCPEVEVSAKAIEGSEEEVEEGVGHPGPLNL